MKNLYKKFIGVISAILLFVMVGCGTNNKAFAEEITLGKTILGEVEFENSEKVKLEKEDDGYEITGQIEAMSPAQVSEFGDEDVTHVVVIKFMFDKERTIDSFEIKGEVTKVYSTDKNVENYVGSISGLLDNDEGEDAFCYLILSANTKEYTLTAKYSDSTTSEIKLEIDATLVTATAE